MIEDGKMIQTQVGDHERIVDFDLFIEVHHQLADEYRALGLTGRTLELAIMANLPRRLAKILDGTVYH